MPSDPIRTLVVEDEPSDRLLLSEIVRSRDHQVWEAGAGEEALRLFEEHEPELVLLDYRLPEADGPDVCRTMRTFSWADDVVILFITGMDQPEALDTALEAGANDYLLKPITGDSIRVRLAIAERQVRQHRKQRELRNALEEDALHDPLTGLASRSLLMDRVEHATRRAQREEDYVFAVLDLNLDDFGILVLEMGREPTDDLLVQTAARLRECIRGTDVAARLSGDRFTILLDGLQDSTDPVRVARRIHESLATPFRAGERSMSLSTGIGIAVSVTGYSDAEAILRDAHRALRRAKARGPASTRIFDPDIHARAETRMEMEGRIREALEKDLFELWYQPVVSLETGRILGVEALARMRDASGDMIPPGKFIPVAEESGLIADLGWWTLRRGMHRIVRWQERYPGPEPLSMAINVSAKQFSAHDFFSRLRGHVEASGVDPESLHLEITETAIMTDVDAAIETLEKLKSLSVGLHVDDFGTGYSSLAYLCRFPVDTLKIDRSFVSTMFESPENQEVVRIIVRLARSLGLGLVAEGVETAEQAELLREMECPAAQGYHFHRPMEEEKLEELLQAGTPAT